MSKTTLKSDKCSYKHDLRQSIACGDYYLGTPQVDSSACFFANDSVQTKRHPQSACKDQLAIDIDSELIGITRKNSRCPDLHYIPGQNTCQTVNLMDCAFIPQEHTRISNPPSTLKSSGWNRWEWLCKDPQEKALVPFDFNISNRLIVKDNHRPCIQQPLDQTSCLPVDNGEIVEYKPQMSCNTSDHIPATTWKPCGFYDAYNI